MLPAGVTTDLRLLLISGSLRRRSVNTAVLRTALDLHPGRVAAELYDDVADLPHYNPDDDASPLHPAVADLRAQIRASDALLFSTPEYAGALPGSFKNLLDWTIGDDQSGSIYEKPVAWINPSPRGAADAHESLRKVLTYANANIIEDACSHIPVTPGEIDDRGLITEVSTRAQIAETLATVASYLDLDA